MRIINPRKKKFKPSKTYINKQRKKKKKKRIHEHTIATWGGPSSYKIKRSKNDKVWKDKEPSDFKPKFITRKKDVSP